MMRFLSSSLLLATIPAIAAADYEDGKTYRCHGKYGLFRYTNNQLSHYVNDAIADSWDPYFRASETTLHCDNVTFGDAMTWNVADIEEGTSIMCFPGTDGKVPENPWYRYWYRLSSNTLRTYINADIARSWNPSFREDMALIDCTGLPMGDAMTWNMATLVEGSSIKCQGKTDGHNRTNRVYRFADNQLSHYPSRRVASSWNPNWKDKTMIDCSGLVFGPDLKKWTRNDLVSGQTIQCKGEGDVLYRYTNKQLSSYVNDAIANSWNPYFRESIKLINCDGIASGDAMTWNVADIEEGTPIMCFPGTDNKVPGNPWYRYWYRLTNNTLRTYIPGDDQSFREEMELIDCTGLIIGA